MIKKNLVKTRSVSFPCGIFDKIRRRTVSTPGGFSRFVVRAVEEKFEREDEKTSCVLPQSATREPGR
nr:MAG TPA: repressor [Caudoviricetes sp.]